MKFLPMIIRNVFRNKIRSLFTASSIAISLFLVVTLYSLLTAQEEAADTNSLSNRVAVLHEAGLAGSLPISSDRFICWPVDSRRHTHSLNMPFTSRVTIRNVATRLGSFDCLGR